MAIYEYTCEEHGTVDLFVKMSDSDKPQLCPSCGKEIYRNENISNCGSFHLKGDWFKTKGKY